MLKLKLDMLYHGLPIEEAKTKYAELTAKAPEVPPPVVEPPKRRRRIVAAAK
jgi:hypothetical protein